MDSTFWNATLRLYINEDCSVVRRKVYSTGLVALDLSGNAIGGPNLNCVFRALQRNHWILGLNLMSNNLTAGDVAGLLRVCSTTAALVALNLYGNPGFGQQALAVLPSALATPASLQKLNLPAITSDLLLSWIGGTVTAELQQMVHSSPVELQGQVVSGPPHSSQIISSSERPAHPEENIYHYHEEDVFEHAIPSSPSQANFLFAIQDAQLNSFQPSSDVASFDERPPSRNSMRPRGNFSPPLLEPTKLSIPFELFASESTGEAQQPLRPKSRLPSAVNTLERKPNRRRPASAPISTVASVSPQATFRRSKATSSYLDPSKGVTEKKKKKKVRPPTRIAQKTAVESYKQNGHDLLVELTEAVGAMSGNLEAVSHQLKEVTGSLAKSVERTIELQRRSQIDFLNHSSRSGSGNVSYLSDSAAGLKGVRRRYTDDGVGSHKYFCEEGVSDDGASHNDSDRLDNFIRVSLRRKLEEELNNYK